MPPGGPKDGDKREGSAGDDSKCRNDGRPEGVGGTREWPAVANVDLSKPGVWIVRFVGFLRLLFKGPRMGEVGAEKG